MRAEQAEAPSKKDLGDCPSCKEPLRSGLWRELQIEFCPHCGGLWLDPGDLLQLAGQRDVDLVLSEHKDE